MSNDLYVFELKEKIDEMTVTLFDESGLHKTEKDDLELIYLK